MNTDDPTGAAIPLLVDVVGAEAAPPQPLHAPLPGARALDADARAALIAESRYILDELLDECLPFLEARLRERLEQRLAELLGD